MVSADPRVEELVAWHAVHDSCPEDAGCCAKVDVEWTDAEWALVESVARAEGVPTQVFIHLALLDRLDREDLKELGG